ARDEPEHGIERGLDKVEAGLRLRYEFSRRFAPYIGISHERRFGDSADHAGRHARDTQWVAGVRMWFGTVAGWAICSPPGLCSPARCAHSEIEQLRQEAVLFLFPVTVPVRLPTVTVMTLTQMAGIAMHHRYCRSRRLGLHRERWRRC